MIYTSVVSLLLLFSLLDVGNRVPAGRWTSCISTELYNESFIPEKKPRTEPQTDASLTVIAGLRNDTSRSHQFMWNGEMRNEILPRRWLLRLALAGVPLSMHNQLRIILMDITLNGLLCIRVILGWLCRLPSRTPGDYIGISVVYFPSFLLEIQHLPNLCRQVSCVSMPALLCVFSRPSRFA